MRNGILRRYLVFFSVVLPALGLLLQTSSDYWIRPRSEIHFAIRATEVAVVQPHNVTAPRTDCVRHFASSVCKPHRTFLNIPHHVLRPRTRRCTCKDFHNERSMWLSSELRVPLALLLPSLNSPFQKN